MSDQDTRIPANSDKRIEGLHLARVVSIGDPTYMGRFFVQLLREVNSDDSFQGQGIPVHYMSPFYGVTNQKYLGESPDVYNETQKAYGMWMVPPDPGQVVLCFFEDGKGYWLGCVLDEFMNFAIPGIAATKFVTPESKQTNKERVPVAEYNKKIRGSSTKDPTNLLKPAHLIELNFDAQGLLEDDVRGITTSSARRDMPSMVFGISTPGPIDKGGKTGPVGVKEYKVAAHKVSRLGGSTFVMDDGDAAWERKKPPWEDVPDYGELGQGDPKRPHNELFRLRTRTGHQILLHNSEDLIYIGNSRGTCWIEMSSDGKLDIYAKDSINIRTEQDFNFYAGRDMNLEIERNFNIKVKKEMHTHVLKDSILIVDENQKVHIKKDVDYTYNQKYKHTIDQDVDILMNQNLKQTIQQNVDILINQNLKETVKQNVDLNYTGTLKTTVTGSVSLKYNAGLKTLVTGNSDYTSTGALKITGNSSLDLKTDGSSKFTAGSSTEIKSGSDNKITAGSSNHLKSGGNHYTSGSGVLVNCIVRATNFVSSTGATASSANTASAANQSVETSATANTATKAELPKILKTHSLPNEKGEKFVDSIMRRIPTFEPYPHHENLDPQKYKSDKIDRDAEGRYEDNTETMMKTPTYWKKYTTSIDTFEKRGDQGE